MKKTILYVSLIGTLLGAAPSEATDTITKKHFNIDGKPVFITYEGKGCSCEVKARIDVYAQDARGMLCQPEQTYFCEGKFDTNGNFQPTGCNSAPPQSILEKLVQHR